jgi:hypothetical protein
MTLQQRKAAAALLRRQVPVVGELGLLFAAPGDR